MGFVTSIISLYFFVYGLVSGTIGYNEQLLIVSGLFMIASAIFSKE